MCYIAESVLESSSVKQRGDEPIILTWWFLPDAKKRNRARFKVLPDDRIEHDVALGEHWSEACARSNADEESSTSQKSAPWNGQGQFTKPPDLSLMLT